MVELQREWDDKEADWETGPSGMPIGWGASICLTCHPT